MGLCTVAQASVELKAIDTSGTAPTPNTAAMLSYIDILSQRLDNVNGYTFQPTYDTRYYTAEPMAINLWAGTLTILQDMFLEPVTIVSETTNLVYGTDVLAYPQNQTPIQSLRLVKTVAPITDWYPRGCERFETIVITGLMGYRQNYARQGFLTSNDSVQDVGGISASASTIKVTSVNGVDYYNMTPRFSPGNLIRIENELCEVRAANTSTNVLTVTRGDRGTTAATHAQGTTIKVYYPPMDLVGACARSVALRYARRGAFDQLRVEGVGIVTYPRDLMAEAYDVISGYSNR